MPAKILCIENEIDFRENMVQILHKAGYETIEVDDAKKALKEIAHVMPDFIICDINLLKNNGFDFYTELIQLSSQAANIPFIFLIAMEKKNDIAKDIPLNIGSYIIKPVDFDILLATIHTKLSHKTQKNLSEPMANNFINPPSFMNSQISNELFKNIKDSLSDITSIIEDKKTMNSSRFHDVQLLVKEYQATLKSLKKIEGICKSIINMIDYALDEKKS